MNRKWRISFFLFFLLGVTWELITLRQMMKAPNEPGLSVLVFDTKFRSSLADLAEQRRQRHLQTVLFQYRRIHDVLMQR